MRSLKLDEIVKEAARYVSQSGENAQLSEADIGEIYYLLEITGLLPPVIAKTGKSDSSSEKFRSSGNFAFVTLKNDVEALRLYTKAIGSATADGKEISLAYANRSAVTFALQEYRHAINDIDRALNGHYPPHLKYKLLERKGRCFHALCLYQKAISEFKRVQTLLSCSNLKTDKIDLMSSQLSQIIDECEGKHDSCLENNSVEPINEIPPFSHDPSNYIQCASNAVDIEYSQLMGRHVVAAVDIYPGDVLAKEVPYSSVLLPPSYDFFCDNCKKRTHSLVPCLHCSELFFCNEECREKSWISHHAIECDMLPTLVSIGCNKMELLSLRVLLNATKCGKELHILVDSPPEEFPENPRLKGFEIGEINKYLSDSYVSTHNLETNRFSRSGADLFRRGVIASCILHVLKEATDYFSVCSPSKWIGNEKHIEAIGISNLNSTHVIVGEILLRHLMSAPCNAHEIAEMRVWPSGNSWETESTEIGGAVYPFHSLINHSCDPNVVRHAFNGGIVVLSAIQFIGKGEQIFDNYGYHHAIHDRETRQSHLKSQYYFACECVACRNNWPSYHNLPEGPPPLMTTDSEKLVCDLSVKFAAVVADIKDVKTTDENFEFLIEYLSVLHQNIKRPWKEYNQCQEAIKQCLSLRANHYIYKTKPLPIEPNNKSLPS